MQWSNWSPPTPGSAGISLNYVPQMQKIGSALNATNLAAAQLPVGTPPPVAAAAPQASHYPPISDFQKSLIARGVLAGPMRGLSDSYLSKMFMRGSYGSGSGMGVGGVGGGYGGAPGSSGGSW
jgi:hypothetical protein